MFRVCVLVCVCVRFMHVIQFDSLLKITTYRAIVVWFLFSSISSSVFFRVFTQNQMSSNLIEVYYLHSEKRKHQQNHHHQQLQPTAYSCINIHRYSNSNVSNAIIFVPTTDIACYDKMQIVKKNSVEMKDERRICPYH